MYLVTGNRLVNTLEASQVVSYMSSKEKPSRPVVAHVLRSYLGLSETFIYSILIGARRVQPVIVADDFQNLNLFPFKPLYTLSSIRRYSWWWFINSLHYRLTDKAQFFENMTYVRHILKKTTTRLIHAHFGPMGVRMLPVKRALNVPLVTTFYGYDMSELPRLPEWRAAYRRLFAEGDLFLVEGGHMRTALIALGCPEDKVEVQRIGVALDKLSFRERKLVPGQKMIVLFCGRFTEKKGLIYALQALTRVVTQVPDLEFRIIGDGEGRADIEHYIAEHDLAPYVRLMGYQPHQVFYEQLKETHLFIQPSVTSANGDTEGGAPTVLLEAQACGVPVLATYHADIPEVVSDGESGLLVPERDPDMLAKKWVELAAAPERWPAMGRAGRQHVKKAHDMQNLTNQLEARYQHLLEQGRVDAHG
jgi:colanic acid/amylovoran biosynthesis glycosyltransferase